MSKKFICIVCDPPYNFSDRLSMSDVKRGAEANYKTMSMDDIKKLPIKDYSDPDGCVLALWVPSSLLQDGLDIMKSWGFNMKQTYIWNKTKKDEVLDKSFNATIKSIIKSYKENKSLSDLFRDFSFNSFNLEKMLSFGMGRLFRQTHEIALIGINNTNIYQKLKNKSQRSVCFAQNLKHSSKPEDLQDALDLMFSGEKLELFSRRKRSGWTCLGNEVCNGEDIRVSLSKL